MLTINCSLQLWKKKKSNLFDNTSDLEITRSNFQTLGMYVTDPLGIHQQIKIKIKASIASLQKYVILKILPWKDFSSSQGTQIDSYTQGY